MLWWKVEVDDGGEIQRCTMVEGDEGSAGAVRYVEAENEAEARETALAWYKRDRATRNAATKRLQNRRRKAGKCRSCQNKLAPGSNKFCPEHLERAREYARTYYHEGPKRTNLTGVDPVIVAERRKNQHRRTNALRAALPTVLAKYEELGGRPWSRFRDWLLLEIASRSGAPSNDRAEAAE